MWFFYVLSWIAMVAQVCFVTLSVAAGLYYMAELVEEYTVMAGKLIKCMLWVTTGVYVGLLLFENLPLTLIVLGLATNLVYAFVLRSFPYIELTSPVFIASLVLIVANHYLAFSYFASVWHPFSEVLAFFTICLWVVPFAFFVSLSANENVLPTSIDSTKTEDSEHDVVSNYFKKKSKKYGLLAFLKTAQDTLLPQRVKKGY